MRSIHYVVPTAAQGIGAESPQDLHKQIRGLAAESPVSGASRRKGAQILSQQNKLDNYI
jgi:hypothetical protein